MAEAKPKTMRVTPVGLKNDHAHLTFTTGRCRMDSAIEVPVDEGEAAIELGLARKADEDQLDFVDEPRELLRDAPSAADTQ